ncbi:protein kinase-like domain-containing protein [Xylariomycetidae sp. FL0641]|nr:protein kinase-like domain-containing protein [Xylariomycetidae sp. FL0641]
MVNNAFRRLFRYRKSHQQFENPVEVMDPRAPTFSLPEPKLDEDGLVDEEGTFLYTKRTWYHAYLGQVLNERYRLITKLGWGATSTVWLARDLQEDKYVGVKICANYIDQRRRELDFLLRLSGVESNHPGAKHVLKFREHFDIVHRHRSLLCLVFDVLGPHLLARVPEEQAWLEYDWVLSQIWCLLQALDFLHTEAKIIHNDAWAPNILCLIEDQRDLAALEQQERTNPSPRKRIGNVFLYESRQVIPRGGTGGPCLADFGNSRLNEMAFSEDEVAMLLQDPAIAADGLEKPVTDIKRLFNTVRRAQNLLGRR